MEFPFVVVARSGAPAIKVLEFEGTELIPNRDAIGYYFTIMRAPMEDPSRIAVVFDRLFHDLIDPRTQFKMLKDLELSDAALVLAEAAIEGSLHMSGTPALTPSGMAATQIWCLADCFEELGDRARFREQTVLDYLVSKLHWSWRFDIVPARFGLADGLIVGGDIGYLRRVAMVEQSESWNITRESESELLIEANPRLLRKFIESDSPPDTPSRVPLDVAGQLSPQADDWDVFICHASEDKDSIARALAEELRRRGLRVWYDDFTVRLGDSLRRTIDRGLSRSRFGIVILSPTFFEKEWPQRELDGLVAREVDGRKVILPVWHNLGADEVRNYSPTLADRVAATTSSGIDVVVSLIMAAL